MSHASAPRPSVVVQAGAPILLLLLFALAFYYPLVFLGRAVVDYDAFVYFQPQRAYLASALLEGRIPLWNPYLFMGAPFLANPQTGVLYPFSWLFVFGPLNVAYTAQLVIHAFLMALFTYLLARYALGASTLGALVGALAFGFGGFTVAQTGHLNQLSAAPWLPAMLLAYSMAGTRRSIRWAGFGALALGLQILAGHPQQTYMSAIALGLFALVCTPWQQPGRVAWAVLTGVLLGVAGLLLSGAQLLPMLELRPLSTRGEGVTWEDAVHLSLPHYLVPRALLPPYWLNVASTEYLGYTGVVPLALAFVAVVFARNRFVWFGALLCFVGLFLAVGENNGYYGLLFATAPAFDTFRVPARWLFLWMFGVAVLASIGATWIARGARVVLKPLSPWLLLRVLFVALVIASALQWQMAEGEPLPQRRVAALWVALAGVAILGGAVATRFYPRIVVALLTAVAAVEVFAVAEWSPARAAPLAWVVTEPLATQQWLSANLGAADRLLTVAQGDYIPEEETQRRLRLAGLSDKVMLDALIALKWRETLIPNLPLEHRIPIADGYDGGVLPLRDFVRLSTVAIPPDRARPDGVLHSRIMQVPPERLLQLFGVTHVLANRDQTPPFATETRPVGNLQVLRLPEPPSHSLLLFDATVADAEDALERMRQPSFDPDRSLVLMPGAEVAERASPRAGIPVVPSIREPERWVARVSMPEDGYLLQREAWYPGWRARVNGAEVPVLQANVLFRAIPLPAGEHEVEIYFRSASFERGVLLSAAGLTAILLMLVWPWVARRMPIIASRAPGPARRTEPAT